MHMIDVIHCVRHVVEITTVCYCCCTSFHILLFLVAWLLQRPQHITAEFVKVGHNNMLSTLIAAKKLNTAAFW